ncbi:MAG: CoA-binding protein [Archaeoglobus sp.]|nr:CoA-binding protein [Archaeoglobus sp.]
MVGSDGNLIDLSSQKERILKEFEPLFNPKSVALIGVSSNSKKMGYHVLQSFLKSGFRGSVYPVNPRYERLFGIKTYPSLDSIPDKVDLVVVAVPQKAVFDVMEDCIRKGVKAAVVISAGFKEAEIEEGEEFHKRLAEIAERGGIRIIGPNTFGMVNLGANLNASFTPALSMIKKGEIALISQSGGVCHVIMPYAIKEGIGFSKIVGLGNRVNTDFHDLLEYLAYDDESKSVALYVEGIDEPRKLMDAAKKLSPLKPVVAYKVGRFQHANKAAKSHTGSLAGRYELYLAAFRQAGVIVVEDTIELVSAAKALAFQPPAYGNRIAVISLVAGLGMISAEWCEIKGLKLVEFSEETQSKLLELLPPYTIRTNPVDLGYVANDTKLCGEVIETVFDDENVDGVVLNYIYSWSEDFLQLPVKEIVEAHETTKKPITMCLNFPPGFWDEEKDFLEKHGIPTFPAPELSAKTMAALVEYGRIKRRSQISS